MTNPPRILLVDDEPFNLDYLEQELEDLNYEILTASNGQEALEKIQNDLPDLVLLDIMMPIMDGFAVLEKVKADPVTRSIPIIVISANSDLQSIVRGIEKGAEDYLPKPFEPTILHARITSSLEKKILRDKEKLYLQSLERELNIARDIQAEFLPFEMPQAQGWEIAAYFKAASEVAGDFYDAFSLPDGNVICVIGDVCGKGVGAALFMTLFRSLIRATCLSGNFAGEGDANPASPAERLLHAIQFTNNYVAYTHESSNMFATVFICLIDVQNHMLHYINGGNDKPFLLRTDGTLEELATTGPAVGAIENSKYRVIQIPLQAGDILLAFTDGIPDSQNPAGEFYGRERASIFMRKHKTVESVVRAIGDDLMQFAGNEKQFDDITLLAVRRLP